jgi:tetraacyldisaccharide 4'-kinase
MAVRARNYGYVSGLVRVHRMPCRVVCVGNLTVGGTGKTPTVLALARAFARSGAKVCVILRGYGRRGAEVVVVSDGRDRLLPWQEVGDEAVLLARRLPGIPVIVGGDRVRAGALALQRFGPDTLLLDDGFQHRRLHRDLDLVLLDATDPFGGGKLVPRGRLREPIQGLGRAHAVLVTRVDQAVDLASLRQRLSGLAPDHPLAWAVHRPVRLVDLQSGEEWPVGALAGRLVHAVSGIANPESFHRTLQGLGARLAGTLCFPDHHPFTEADLAHIAAEAKALGAEWILTTEKDAVRLDGDLPQGFPVLALGITLEVIEGGRGLEQLLGISLHEARRG